MMTSTEPEDWLARFRDALSKHLSGQLDKLIGAALSIGGAFTVWGILAKAPEILGLNPYYELAWSSAWLIVMLASACLAVALVVQRVVSEEKALGPMGLLVLSLVLATSCVFLAFAFGSHVETIVLLFVFWAAIGLSLGVVAVWVGRWAISNGGTNSG